jgi:hypothetical protein
MENKAAVLLKRQKSLLAERRGLLDVLQLNIPPMNVLNIEDDQDLELPLISDIWTEFNQMKAEKAEEQLKSQLVSIEEKHKMELSNLIMQSTKALNDDTSEATEVADGVSTLLTSSSITHDANEIIQLKNENEVKNCKYLFSISNVLILYVVFKNVPCIHGH